MQTDMASFSLNTLKSVHCIGIKGAGMAALAEILVRRGIQVTGSDTDEVFFTDALLKQLQIPYTEQFAVENIPADVNLVIYSTAYAPERNEELAAALASGKPVLSYPEAVGLLTREYMTLAVCGTHGKTTTSALLAEVLYESGKDPVALVGSHIRQWQGSALVGTGKYFVLEADEYQNKLRQYDPFVVILTSVDWDHPDFFPDAVSYEQAFVDFVERVPKHGFVIACGDSASVERVSATAQAPVVRYGFLASNEYRIVGWQVNDIHGRAVDSVKQRFEIMHGEKSLGTFELRLAGKHNALNAAAVVAVCDMLRIDLEKVRVGLARFDGTARRFEYVGEKQGAIVYDDYAHHPEEVHATAQAFKELYPNRRLVVVFHPHTFTRTKALLQEFSQSFEQVDVVYLLDIYGSAREEQGGVSSDDLVSLINRYFPGKAVNVHTIDEAVEVLRNSSQVGDLIVTMGAGNVWEVGKKFLES